jgi:hypothetical protein
MLEKDLENIKNSLENLKLNLQNIDYETLLKGHMYRLAVKESQKKYIKSHKEKINEIRRRCYQKKVNNDPEYKVLKALRAKEYYHRRKAEKNLEIFV